MENILELKNISKSFKQYNVLHDIDLTIKKGDIYGLIGKNGAGKTTLLKIITSLSKQSSGTIQLFGSHTHKDFIHSLKRTGSVIETPVAYDNLSAKENLIYYSKLRGVVDEKDIEDTLKLVDLSDVGKKKFKHFSLGMKQKLGIAIALLSKPDFLILDEPINGLDPIAIVEFRELLKKLNTELNITILISSHILTELYHVANRFGILNNGTLVEEITKEEFEKMSQTMITLQVTDTAKVTPILHEHSIHNFKIISSSEINIYEPEVGVSELIQILMNEKIAINGIYKTGIDLENHFKSLVDGTVSTNKEDK
ncbi:ABC transporter [Vagococcus martis]|uniref:ABC transporter n=1 Tax=Vagococcus martis TaxID=1768210 RepID=A0A1V4DHP7_9ENTE|nr:ABC transporter ATP-binding protein [Vagococcus martis]OPF88065.1 ABC transporter [Vagococcus martis]